MKDNGKYYDPGQRRGGRLLEGHYDTFARYFVAYLQAYRKAGVDIWALTPVNAPHRIASDSGHRACTHGLK